MKKRFNTFFIASIIALLPGQSKGQEQEENILEIQGKKIQDFNENVKKLAEQINILESTDELLLKDFTETANLIKTISKFNKRSKGTS